MFRRRRARQHAVVAGDELCLVPALARFARSAPTGATLTRCEATGDLVLLKDATSESVAVSSGWRTNDELLLTEGWADPALRSDAAALTLNDCVDAADAAFGAAGAALGTTLAQTLALLPLLITLHRRVRGGAA